MNSKFKTDLLYKMMRLREVELKISEKYLEENEMPHPFINRARGSINWCLQ